MLEVLELRAAHEPLQVVVTAHPSVSTCRAAWEPRLGHAGDPLRMRTSVGSAGARRAGLQPRVGGWATARRSLNACDGDVVGYTAYLDKFHSARTRSRSAR